MKLESRETRGRSVVKTITYRLYQSLLISPLTLWILTGDIKLSFAFGLAEIFVKLPTYYIFERLWSLIDKGYLYKRV